MAATSALRHCWLVFGAAVVGFVILVAGAFWAGWVTVSGRHTSTQSRSVATTAAVPDSARTSFGSPTAAALAAAHADAPNVADVDVSRVVGIYADNVTVELRLQVEASGFCHWYGAAGTVQDGVFQWHGEPAGPC